VRTAAAAAEYARKWRKDHPDLVSAYSAKWREAHLFYVHERDRALKREEEIAHPGRHAERERARRARDPEAYNASVRERRRAHPAREKAAVARRRESLAKTPRYVRLNPWPSDCQVCNDPIDPALRHPDPLSATLGHEPPIAWLSHHPAEYEGDYWLRPEHLSCNRTKNSRPDWELSL
jgi:hypothetical protein